MKTVVAEKPSVAKQLAKVIGADTPHNGYMEGNGYYVTWCIGHLTALMYPAAYDEKYKKWDVSTLPILPREWKYGISSGTKEQYDIVKSLLTADDVTEVVCATDAGREGELIFRNVYNKCGCKKPILRLWISSMEDSAIRNGFVNLRRGEDYESLYRAALARERSDWLIGMNLSRLYTLVYGGGEKLSIGRVMTPTLAMICERDEKASGFVKEKFYTVHLKNGGYDFVSPRFSAAEEEDAKKTEEACDGKTLLVTSVEKKDKKQSAPLLYDLSSLQQDCNRLFGYTADETLSIAQELYEKKLTTYPRTDARYLTEDMEDTIVKAYEGALGYLPAEVAGASSTSPVNVKRLLDGSKVSDHHAIIITSDIDALSSITDKSRAVYDLVCLRIIEALSPEYRYTSVTAKGTCANMEFTMSGRNVTDMGYRAITEAFEKKNRLYGDDEKAVPDVSEGMSLFVTAALEEGQTKPPAAYTDATLLAAMEKAGNSDMDSDVERKGLGTSATRASVIEKLIKDGYITRNKKKLNVTEAGKYLISVVPDRVKSVSLTCDFENELLAVSLGKSTYDTFMADITGYISDMVASSKNVTPKPVKAKETVCECPVCQSPVSVGKYGLYCTGKCGVSFSFARKALTQTEAVSLFTAKKEVLIKNLTGKNGKPYDIYIKYGGKYEKTEYVSKDGSNRTGYRLVYETRFPDKSGAVKNKKKKG